VRGKAVRRNDVIDQSLNVRSPEAPLDAQLAGFGRSATLNSRQKRSAISTRWVRQAFLHDLKPKRLFPGQRRFDANYLRSIA
jgi:hypothetical protein